MTDESELYVNMMTRGNPFSLSRLFFLMLLIGIGIAILFLTIGVQLVGKENVQRYFDWSKSAGRITQGYQQESQSPDCIPPADGSEAFFDVQGHFGFRMNRV